VLYTACPALDGIHTDRAVHVAGTVEALNEEIRKEVDAGPRPRRVPDEVFEQYGVTSVVSRIDDLYEQILADRPRRVRARRRRLSAESRQTPVRAARDVAVASSEAPAGRPRAAMADKVGEYASFAADTAGREAVM
jgi:hypothetical protein